jgi:hypothetical protein
VAGTRPRTPESSGRVTVPKLNRDPVQSLCPFPVEVTVAGHDYLIPALPASVWLSVLMADDLDLSDVFPGLLDEQDMELFEDSVISGQVTLEELEEVILGVIETASARRWFVALRLIEVAKSSWDVLGAELGLRGVDAAQVSLSQWLDILLILALRNMEEKDVQMFCLKLEAPPEGTQDAEPEMEMSESAFMAMAQ